MMMKADSPPSQPTHANLRLASLWYAPMHPLRARREREFAQQNREAHDCRQNQIHDEERKAPAVAHLVGEAPDVAQPDGRTDGSHEKTEIAAPCGTLVVHSFS